MKTIWIQFNKFKGEKTYKLNAISNKEIEKAIFAEITQEDINEIQEMLNDVK